MVLNLTRFTNRVTPGGVHGFGYNKMAGQGWGAGRAQGMKGGAEGGKGEGGCRGRVC